jgi:hypothetical protein
MLALMAGAMLAAYTLYCVVIVAILRRAWPPLSW